MSVLDTDKVERFIDLTRQIEKKEEKVDELKEERAELEKELMPVFKAGTQRCNIRGKGTVSMSRRVNASSGGDVPRMIKALKADDEDWLVKDTVNATSLTGYVLEFDPDRMLSPDQIKAKLPPAIAKAIKITEKYKLSVTKK